MFALDTNLLVRWATNDNASQVSLANKAMVGARAWIGVTVVLETEWVLRARYGAPRDEIVAFFDALMGLKNFDVEDADAVARAFAMYLEGADFADALHIARMPASATMLTFDRTFATQAVRTSGAVQIIKPPR